MSHWAPSITEWGETSDGSLRISWEVDSFYEDSEAPDDVLVELNGVQYQDLGKTGRSITIPPKDLKRFQGTVVNVGVVFVWSGSPGDSKVSTVSIPVAAAAPTQTSGPAKPTVTIDSATPQTLKQPNQLTLSWSSTSYNDGNILWGPISSPRAWTHSIKPKKTIYAGQWPTDNALAPHTDYSFTVQVKNSLTTNAWVETTIAARSATNLHSVRQFLIASGVTGSSVRSAFGHAHSLRQAMGI